MPNNKLVGSMKEIFFLGGGGGTEWIIFLFFLIPISVCFRGISTNKFVGPLPEILENLTNLEQL